MNTYVLNSVAQDRWWSLLQRAWTLRVAATPSAVGENPDGRARLEAAAQLRERIRHYERTQPSYAADLTAALAQLERASNAP